MTFKDPSHTKNCAHCCNVFARDKRNTWAYWEKAKFCSRECNAAAWSITAAKRRPSIEDKFAEYVIRSDEGCWPWSGPKDKDGYGVFFYEGKQYRAPPFALKLDGRPVPKGMMACHHCDNPICIRPTHLYPGTSKQNIADMMSRGRGNHGKKLTWDQVIEIRKLDDKHETIAAIYGVSRSNISLIKERKTWRTAP